MPRRRWLWVEGALLVALTLVLHVVADVFDVFEAFVDWSQRYPGWNLGEALLVTAVMCVVVAGIAVHRNRALGREVSRRLSVERQLGEQVQRYRSLFDYNPALVFSLDTSGRFTELNGSTERVTGLPPEQVVGRSFVELLPTESAAGVVADFGRALEGESVERRLEVCHVDGRVRVVQGQASPIRVDGEVVGVHGVFTDVTEKHRLQRELLRLSAAVEAAAEGFAVAEASGRVIYEPFGKSCRSHTGFCSRLRAA